MANNPPRSLADALSANVAELDSYRRRLEPLIKQLGAAKSDNEFRAILANAKLGDVLFDALEHITRVSILLDDADSAASGETE